MEDFNFSDTDLHANREGRLTENQLDILKQKSNRKLIILIIVIAVFGFVLIATLSKPTTTTNNGFLNVILVIFIIGMAYIMIADYRKLQSDVASGTVDRIYGQPSFRTFSGGRNSRFYRVSIGEKKFGLTRVQYQALEAYFQKESPGTILTVYFTPVAQVILSLEPKS